MAYLYEWGRIFYQRKFQKSVEVCDRSIVSHSIVFIIQVVDRGAGKLLREKLNGVVVPLHVSTVYGG